MVIWYLIQPRSSVDDGAVVVALVDGERATLNTLLPRSPAAASAAREYPHGTAAA
jgi:SOS-response transcriptional repressor LexA